MNISDVNCTGWLLSKIAREEEVMMVRGAVVRWENVMSGQYCSQQYQRDCRDDAIFWTHA